MNVNLLQEQFNVLTKSEKKDEWLPFLMVPQLTTV